MTTTVWTYPSPSPRSRRAMAAGLALTVAMGLGIFAATMAFWMSSVKAAFDGRKPIGRTLSATLSSQGIKAAVRQYEQLKAAEPAAYDFDERELSVMGRRLIRERRFEEGFRILHLNAEAYPRSTRVYERLADAYMEEGDTALAVANYRKSLEMDPSNAGPARMLVKLDASAP
jgi:tetratricopeptide (TPR) repeat protein